MKRFPFARFACKFANLFLLSSRPPLCFLPVPTRWIRNYRSILGHQRCTNSRRYKGSRRDSLSVSSAERKFQSSNEMRFKSHLLSLSFISHSWEVVFEVDNQEAPYERSVNGRVRQLLTAKLSFQGLFSKALYAEKVSFRFESRP